MSSFELLSAIDWHVAKIMAFNFSCSVGIIYANKLLFVYSQFTFATFVTMLHFCFTSICMHVCMKNGMFEKKSINILNLLPFSTVFCCSIVFNNLSLQYNSVGFYQLMKILTTPSIIIIEQLIYKKVTPDPIKLSLVPVCVGVAIAVVTDVELNLIGTFYSVAGVLANSYYQIWCGTKTKELGVNSMQLLYYQAPLAAVILMFATPMMDNVSGPDGLLAFDYTLTTLFAIFLTACIAFGVNLSVFLIIGKTSPVTYNVLGHCKTVCILAGGFVVFAAPFIPMNILGVIITLGGVFWYTHLKLHMQLVQQQQAALERVPDSPGSESSQVNKQDKLYSKV